MFNCPFCNEELIENTRFCPTCGKDVSKPALSLCSSCGVELIPGKKFCHKCGAKVGKKIEQKSNYENLSSDIMTQHTLSKIKEETFKREEVSKSHKKIIITLSVIIFVIIVVIAFKIIDEKKQPSISPTIVPNISINWKRQMVTTPTGKAIFEKVYFINPQSGWIVGYIEHQAQHTDPGSGVIFHTINGGNVWSSQNTETLDPRSDVYFVDSKNGWCVGNNNTIIISDLGEIVYTILHTNDGGETWKRQKNGSKNKSIDGVCFVDLRNGWVVGQGGRISHTNNGGKTWVDQKNCLEKQLNKVCFVDLQNGWVAGVDGTILHTTDGGKIWAPQMSGTTEYLGGIDFIDSNNGWVTGSNGTILHTTDGGKTWVPQMSGTTEHLGGIDFTDSNNGWVVGTNGTILHTTDEGNTWKCDPSGTLSNLNSVYFVNSKEGWIVGDDGIILKYSSYKK